MEPNCMKWFKIISTTIAEANKYKKIFWSALHEFTR